jgi:hypothetical protein
MSTTTSEATERAAIEAAVQLYIDGASKGDAEKINETFHEAAWMYGHVGGQRFDMPAAQLAETVAAQPLDSDGSFSARIASLEQVGDVARVTLEEDGARGSL